MRAERGFSLAIVLAVLALVVVAFAALQMLTRAVGEGDERQVTERRLGKAADAIEQFAAASSRLPCPANGADVGPTEGTEARTAGSTTCDVPTGVVPWRTIGLRKEDAADAWGRRLSYRVYTGAAGSLTQDGGISMVFCDSHEPNSVGTGPTGLCIDGGTPVTRNTSEASFYLNKSLTFKDMGVPKDNVAFIVISHGASGLGARSVSGTLVEPDPAPGAERNNLSATGGATGFEIQAFSDKSKLPGDNGHFDDLLVYRTLPDIVRRIGLSARDWTPEPTPPGSTAFTVATIDAVPGVNVNSATGATNRDTIDFGPFTAYGRTGGSASDLASSTATNFSAVSQNGNEGLGIFSVNPKITFGEREWVGFVFDDSTSTRFGITLNDFGIYSQSGVTMAEKVQIEFYSGSIFAPVLRKRVTAVACRADGGLASFSVDVAQAFSIVVVTPVAATASTGSATGDTGFYISEMRTCSSSSPNCYTGLSSVANTCPDPT